MKELLDYLRARLGPDVDYETPPTRLSGGFDTTTMGFTLSGAPPEYGGGLILRVMPRPDTAVRVRREAATHAALIGAGFPAPRILVAETDPAVLGKPFLITGSPGGSRIITAVLQIIVNAIDFHMPIDQAVSAPRLHHQWQPDEVYVEPGFAPEVLEALAKRGHNVVPTPSYSSTNSIEITPDGYIGAADRRSRGSLAAGY